MNPLQISTAQLRRLAERITQLSAEYLEDLDSKPISPPTTGEESFRLFHAPLPEQGLGEHALDDIAAVINASRVQNGRFFGYVLGSGEPVGAVADLVASVLNQNVTAWGSGPAAVMIEKTVVGWLAQAIGCGDFRGYLTGGGSSANLMGLTMAREAIARANEHGITGRAVVYASEEIHMSIPKSVALLGVGRDNFRVIPTDSGLRMDLKALEAEISHDKAEGKTPLAIVASAGTVKTGALDPHKWLYQPLDCGCLLYRSADAAQQAFSHSGDYARALTADPVEGFAFFEESLELSRRFRALKLWISLRYHGLAAFRESIKKDLSQAHRLAEAIKGEPELELIATGELSAVCFRFRARGAKAEEELNQFNLQLLGRIVKRGRVYLSNAAIAGTFCLRACIVNHRTTDVDVDAVVAEVLAAAQEMPA